MDTSHYRRYRLWSCLCMVVALRYFFPNICKTLRCNERSSMLVSSTVLAVLNTLHRATVDDRRKCSWNVWLGAVGIMTVGIRHWVWRCRQIARVINTTHQFFDLKLHLVHLVSLTIQFYLCLLILAFKWVDVINSWEMLVLVTEVSSNSLPLAKVSHLEDLLFCAVGSFVRSCSKQSFISLLLFLSASLWVTRNSGVRL